MCFVIDFINEYFINTHLKWNAQILFVIYYGMGKKKQQHKL